MNKENWEVKKFKECFKLKSGDGLSAKDMIEGQYQVFGGNGFIRMHNAYNIDGINIIIGRVGALCGNVHFVEGKIWLTDNAFQVFLIEKRFRLLFLKYLLSFLNLRQYAKEAVQPVISNNSLQNVFIPIPPIPIQEKIVKELDTLHNILAKKKEQLKGLDKLAQATFYDMFGDPKLNNKGWEIKILGNHLNVVGGYAFKSSEFAEKGVPILRIGNINSGQLKTDNIVFYNEKDSLNRYLMRPYDLVISLTGTAGKDDYGNVCILDDTYEKYYLNQRNAKLDIVDSLNIRYLQYLLKDSFIKGALVGINRGIRQGNISNGDIQKLLVPFPPLSLQNQFAAKIEAIEKQKELINLSIKDVEQLIGYTMDKYFN